MAKNYNFGEKETEYNPKLGKDVGVWKSPKYLEARKTAVETLESDTFGKVLSEADFWILTGLTKSGKVAYNGLIISHNGCLKINDALPKEKKFRPSCMSLDKEGYNGSLVYTYCCDSQGVFEVGEVSKTNCTNGYPYAMALKRCMDRVILKNSRLAYSGIYSDSEAEEFTKDPEEPKAAPKALSVDKEKVKASREAKRINQEVNQVPPTNEIPRASELPVEIKANPRQDLVTYCTAKGLRITEIARTYKLNNGSKDEEFIKALADLKRTCGE